MNGADCTTKNALARYFVTIDLKNLPKVLNKCLIQSQMCLITRR
ncbi:hypothetical protein PMAN_a2365 [Pseudoalteromonas marina]|nr:hypothetical protein PMAN_a2365 [Pseudoalteromonas marina]